MKLHRLRKLQLSYRVPFIQIITTLFLGGVVNFSDLGVGRCATSITETAGGGDLGTAITLSGNVYGIGGGKQVGNNLLHSFDQFNVATGDVAQFQTMTLTPNTSFQNILGRVTGQNPSAIFGTIDSATYYPNANFYLMNPSGIIFGPDAALNIGGSVNFTSANYIRLFDGTNSANFYANPASDAITITGQMSILSSAPLIDFGFVTPAAFGFLNATPAAIAIQGSTLSNGQSISLIGGNTGFMYINPDTGVRTAVPDGITISGGQLSSQGGEINVASVASSGELSLVDFMPIPTMTMGDISLTQGTMLNVSDNSAGTVRIRGGQLELAESTILANTNNAHGTTTAIDIHITGDLLISNDTSSPITATTTGSGNAGDVRISSANLTAVSNSFDILSFIDTHTSGTGNAGNINVTTGTLEATGNPEGLISLIYTGTEGPGRGGDATITAQNIGINGTLGGITTGNFIANLLGKDATGSGGDVTISAENLNLTFSLIKTDAFSFTNNSGQSGNILITAPNINLINSGITSAGHEHGGSIVLDTDHLSATNSRIIVQSNLQDGGALNINGRVIELSASSLVSSTGGNGNAGPINVTATDHVGLLRNSPLDRPSGIFSNSFGTFGKVGAAGDVTITTPRLDMTSGARINTSSATSGHGGAVTITTDVINMSGESGDFAPEPLFSLGVIQPSGIFTLSVGGQCLGVCGNAGNISITTDSLFMGTGSQINSGSSSSGQGGAITIAARDTMVMSGTITTGQSGGIQSRSISTSADAGIGGNISLTAGQSISVSNGAAISASSTGPGNAGNIFINAGQHLDVQNGSITTQADQAGGGDIDIRAIDMVRLVNNSEISTSVKGAEGSGGNIFIDPNTVILQGSSVTAEAVGGAGGNITFVTPLFLTDVASRVSATSQRGPSGTVNILSPLANLSSTVGQLVSKTSPPQVLLQNRCAALAGGEQSTFIVAGRDRLPSEPGGWLSSPVSTEPFTGEGLRHASGPSASARVGETAMLSLRRLTPPGFLVRSFAVGPTGCSS